MAHPVSFQVEYARGERSRVLATLAIPYFVFKLLLLIPHLVALLVLWLGAVVATYAGYVAVAATGQLPRGVFDPVAGVIGWWGRAHSWLLGTTDRYPPFSAAAEGYPVQVRIPYGTGRRSRGLAVLGLLLPVKLLAALPQLVIGLVLILAQLVAAFAGSWAILFTGTLPHGIHDFVAGVTRWNVRVAAWVAGLVDTFPPFTMAERRYAERAGDP